MRLTLLSLVLLAAPAAAQKTDTWKWSGTVPNGATLSIRNINGSIRTEAGGSTVEITALKQARRGTTDAVEIRVDQSGGEITVCALWPGEQSRSGCRSNGRNGQTSREDRDANDRNQVSVDFTIRVPAGVHLHANTINGEIDARGLAASAKVATVNGSVRVQTQGVAEANTVNGNVDVDLGQADWTGRMTMRSVNGDVTVQMPGSADFSVEGSTVHGAISSDFPVSISGRLRPQSLRGRVGDGGGRSLVLSTVNGSIRLEKH